MGFAIEFFNVEAKLQATLGFNPQYGLMALVLVLNTLVIQWMAFQGMHLHYICDISIDRLKL